MNRASVVAHILLCAANWCTSDPEGHLQALALSSHKSNKARFYAAKNNANRTDGRVLRITRHTARDGLYFYKSHDYIECANVRGIKAGPLSFRVVSRAAIFVECLGPNGPEYVRSGTFMQDPEGRLVLIGKEKVMLVNKNGEIIYVTLSPAIKGGQVIHMVDGQLKVAGQLKVIQAAAGRSRLQTRLQTKALIKALPGNTWMVYNPISPIDKYHISEKEVAQGGENIINITRELKDISRCEKLRSALLKQGAEPQA